MKLGVGFATLLAAASATLTYGVSIDGQPRALCLLSGTAQERLTGIIDASVPSWSPDGAQFVFVSEQLGGLEVADAHGDIVHSLVPPVRGELLYQPVWSPTGNWIAYVTGYYGQSVQLISPDGSRWQPTGAAGGIESLTDSPTWAPDGEHLDYAYSSSDPGNGPSGVYSIAVDGDAGHLVVPGGEDPALSPDGKKLAYVKTTWVGSTSIDRDLFVANADGSDEQRLTFTANLDEHSPAWSPDGKTIAFEVGDSRIDEYDLTRFTERTVVRATTGYDLLPPTWRPPSASPAGRAQRCVIEGTSKADVLNGTKLADIIFGGGGNDVIRGGGGDDIISGGPGHDHLYGGPGDDTFFERDGWVDWIDGGPGHDEATCDFFDRRRSVEDYCNY